MVFNATFNNISAISWQSVLLMEEIREPGENHRQTLSHNVESEHLGLDGIQTYISGDGTNYTGSCKSNYHTITTPNVRCYQCPYLNR